MRFPGSRSRAKASPNPGARNAIVYNSGEIRSREPPITTVLQFLKLLRQRYESVLNHLGEDDESRRQELRANLLSLSFAEAFFEKGELGRASPKYPPQIAILGPTQSGKSTMVNWLLGREAAGVSPLAGYTVHPDGFAIDLKPAEMGAVETYFRHLRRCPRTELPRDDYDCYALEESFAEPSSPLRETIVWDTPDFDSVDAEHYRTAVLRVAALADVVVLVLSKDKYADLAVWQVVQLLEALGQPTLICLNKIDPPSFSTLLTSLQQKWQAVRHDPAPPIIAIPYVDSAERDGLNALNEERSRVLTEIRGALAKVRREAGEKREQALLKSHWAEWTAPVRAEHRLDGEWQALVDEALAESLAFYRRDYLNHPHHYETFQRALAELLTLLEIPGVAGVLLAARQVVTWPVRQVMKLGRRAAGGKQPAGNEAAILRQAADHAFIRIGETLTLKRDGEPLEDDWWRDLSAALREAKPALQQRFKKSANQYMRDFEPEIDATARGLYERLKEHPAMLNSLRATRVTTDAAALAVALHTGGIGVHDFIIAPAILSLTTLLAEGALGRYMDKAAADLKAKQQTAVERLLGDTLKTALAGLPARLDASRRFAIAPETLAAAEKHIHP